MEVLTKRAQTWRSSMPVRKEPLLSDYFKTGKTVTVDTGNLGGLTARPAPDDFPSISEPEIVRHYYRLSRLNYSWDDGLYPLGSCTMKYNPIINEKLAADPLFGALHPAIPDEHSQGALSIVYETQQMIAEIIDLPGLSLLPAAGAHGELAGVFMMRKYFEDRGENRNKILIPDSAHGTNPASAAMGAYVTEKITSDERGLTDLEALQNAVDSDTAALMITNPNTLGIFEKDILEIKKILDSVGALLYVDGANLNAIMGVVSFEKMGVDLTQLNLHKTFSTPHGGGGPGQGALGCSARMLDYLPSPLVEKSTKGGVDTYRFASPAKSVGPMKTWYGQFGNIVRAWTYLKTYGKEIKGVSERAVLNANYLAERLSPYLEKASQEPVMHEAVFVQKTLSEKGVTTKNFAKALLERGFYAPTVYFPLHVDGAIMVEPTETESKAELDQFAEAVADVFEALESDSESIKNAPQGTFVREIDETTAARKPVLTWKDE